MMVLPLGSVRIRSLLASFSAYFCFADLVDLHLGHLVKFAVHVEQVHQPLQINLDERTLIVKQCCRGPRATGTA